MVILLVGSNKEFWINEAEKEFLKRLQKYVTIEYRLVKEITKGDYSKIIDNESTNILQKIREDEFVCLLDLAGQALNSLEFADKINTWQDLYGKKVVFIVGGSLGVSNKLRERANFILKLSNMTFTHQMIRIFLLEQIYRAFTIIKGIEYHK